MVQRALISISPNPSPRKSNSSSTQPKSKRFGKRAGMLDHGHQSKHALCCGILRPRVIVQRSSTSSWQDPDRAKLGTGFMLWICPCACVDNCPGAGQTQRARRALVMSVAPPIGGQEQTHHFDVFWRRFVGLKSIGMKAEPEKDGLPPFFQRQHPVGAPRSHPFVEEDGPENMRNDFESFLPQMTVLMRKICPTLPHQSY